MDLSHLIFKTRMLKFISSQPGGHFRKTHTHMPKSLLRSTEPKILRMGCQHVWGRRVLGPTSVAPVSKVEKARVKEHATKLG